MAHTPCLSPVAGDRLRRSGNTLLRRPGSRRAFETSARNLLVVLRESHGENKQDESLQPFGKLRATLADGREIQLETSWYQYLGDMHIRLVFDGAQSLQSASPADLSRLQAQSRRRTEAGRRQFAAALRFTRGGAVERRNDAGARIALRISQAVTSSIANSGRRCKTAIPKASWWQCRAVAAWCTRPLRTRMQWTAFALVPPLFTPAAPAPGCHRACTCLRTVIGRVPATAVAVVRHQYAML